MRAPQAKLYHHRHCPATGPAPAPRDATNILHGALLAIEEANAKGGGMGYQINIMSLDNGTATAGRNTIPRKQAATNARKMVSEATVVAAIGPMAQRKR